MTGNRDDIKKINELTPLIKNKIIARYGKKGVKALTALEEKRVLKYLDFFVVIGNSGEYVVADDFCTCHDFSFRQTECWHILAVKIAEYMGDYDEIAEWYQDRWVKKDEFD